MQAIKSFLYLDEYKMYSISSQIFEGITEYLIDYSETAKEETEQQSGLFGSGRVLADILKSAAGTQERKYLHDYSYNLFEERLKGTEGRVISVSAANIGEAVERIDDATFIEVRGKPIFNDMNIIKSTLKDFNEFGKALAYVGSLEEINAVRQQLDSSVETATDRNEKARLRARLKQLTNIENLAKDKGLYQDPKFLEHLVLLLNFGFRDQFEVQIPVGPYTFSANLKREYLREDENMLVRKYSRFSEKDFVLFGTVSQSSTKPAQNSAYDESSEPQQMREAVMRIVEGLSQVEISFSGKLDNEIIIDPITLYREV